jgi:hypothetical protein
VGLSWEYEVSSETRVKEKDTRFRGLMIALMALLLFLAIGGIWGA